METSEHTPPASLVGYALGSYYLEEEIGASRYGKVYRAQQSSVGRTVALKVLDPELALQPGLVEQFMEESRRAAQIVHSNIVAVLEAGEAAGYYFCAMEFMDGPPLQDYLTRRAAEDAPAEVDEHHLLLVIQGIGRAIDFLWQREIPHQPPLEKNVLVNTDNLAKLKEVEPPTSTDASASVAQDLLAVGVLLAETANRIGPVSKDVGQLVERMVGSAPKNNFTNAGDLVEAAGALDRKLFPPTRADEVRIGKIETKKTNPIVLIASAVAAVLLIAVLVWSWRQRIEPEAGVARPDDLGTMVLVPAGEFLFGEGVVTNLPAFEIDKYEVTIGDYQEFLEAIAGGAEFRRHARDLRRGSNFKPLYWDDIVRLVTQNGIFNNGAVTWDTPVFGVSWFDAYAYASWKQKRLPTALEWEKAARGTEGWPYPWGHDPAPGRANVNSPTKWAQVYEFPEDRSPFGVIGMGGNVSEWTSTLPSRNGATVCGGSFTDKNAAATITHQEVLRTYKGEGVGFRCARSVGTASPEPADSESATE